MPTTAHRRRASAVAALTLVALVAGCGSSGTTSSPTKSPAPPTTSVAPPPPAAPSTTSVAPPPSPAPSSTSSAGSSANPAPVPGDGRTACPTNQLSISDKPASGGLGHFGIVLVFVNHGSTCTLTGYPGVDGVNGGTTVIHAQRTLRGPLGGATSTMAVTLAAGASASALLEGSVGPQPGQQCARYTSLLVTPPNNQQSVTLSVRAPICSPQIHPVVTGAAGGASS